MIMCDSISITQAKHEEDVFVVTVVECKVVPFHCYMIRVVWLWRMRKFWDKKSQHAHRPRQSKIFLFHLLHLSLFLSLCSTGPPKDGFHGRKWRLCQSFSPSTAERSQASKTKYSLRFNPFGLILLLHRNWKQRLLSGRWTQSSNKHSDLRLE